MSPAPDPTIPYDGDPEHPVDPSCMDSEETVAVASGPRGSDGPGIPPPSVISEEDVGDPPPKEEPISASEKRDKDPEGAAPGSAPALPPTDVGYAWVIVACSFLMQAFTLGMQVSFGPFLRYFLNNQTFGTSSNLQLALVSSLSSGITFAAGPWTGRLAEKIGFRTTAAIGALLVCSALQIASLATQLWHLYLSFSLIGGIGVSFSFIPAAAIVPQWFQKRMGLAIGISVAGSGIGALVLNPLQQLMMDRLSWQWAFRVDGFISLVMGLVGAALIRTRLPHVARKAGIKNMFDFGRFKDFTFVRVYVMCLVSGLGYFVVFLFLPAYGGTIGVSPSLAALTVGIANGVGAFGRIFTGFIADYVGAMNVWLASFYVASLLVLLLWTNAKVFGVYLTFAILFGLAGNSYTSLYTLNAARIWGAQGQASLLGLLYTALIWGSLLGPVIGGGILDAGATTAPDGTKTFNYLGLQLFSGFTQLAGATILLWVRIEFGAKKGGKGWWNGLWMKI
ncbi:major facilitator superfamily domain-containing protein [Hyaloraphidium curvatum]|nr:major facilitator superfamily domain-containing protein [Hyaloraphidium curvatum]